MSMPLYSVYTRLWTFMKFPGSNILRYEWQTHTSSCGHFPNKILYTKLLRQWIQVPSNGSKSQPYQQQVRNVSFYIILLTTFPNFQYFAQAIWYHAIIINRLIRYLIFCHWLLGVRYMALTSHFHFCWNIARYILIFDPVYLYLKIQHLMEI